jgi:hypothetical protein
MECPKTHIYYPNTVRIFCVPLGQGGYTNAQRRRRKRRLMLKLFLGTNQRRKMTIRKTGALLLRRGNKYPDIWKDLMLNT